MGRPKLCAKFLAAVANEDDEEADDDNDKEDPAYVGSRPQGRSRIARTSRRMSTCAGEGPTWRGIAVDIVHLGPLLSALAMARTIVVKTYLVILRQFWRERYDGAPAPFPRRHVILHILCHTILWARS